MPLSRSPDGYIFDKEAILEYIIHKKAENQKKLKEYEKNRKREEREAAELAAAEEESRNAKFMNLEKNILNKGTATSDVGKNIVSSISNMSTGKEKKLPSFWIPSETPSSSKSGDSRKPDTAVYCPMSNKPLRAKDLYPVMFTPIDREASLSTSSNKKVRLDCCHRCELIRCCVAGPVHVPRYRRRAGELCAMRFLENLVSESRLVDIAVTVLLL